MSLPDSSMRSPLRLAGLACLLAAGLALGGCGFQPLYGANSRSSTVAFELSSITIVPSKNRVAQQVRNHLISTMSPPGQASPAAYRLELEPAESLRDVFIRPNSDITRQNYTLRVRYNLYDHRTNRLLDDGSVFSIVSYDRVQSEFANVRAQRNAQTQAARAVADDIRTALAAYLSVH